ncbi:RND family efflux transporter MFP subunit [Algoriphagus sp. 4150]|uniref:efflux RND transporter periplasmic adaptor subunit n=1 Tax=Algoriphagus sp. 4150 TaxID=2817756 RepID=UPI00285A85F4|nr:efflux RND transporter periplasmic adaptor subunit [Algoriphagus sp. 4150]MDR7131998.1 RND family efflux transporter MFP subunit [Algoriphagus sp. 4150]
MRTLKISLMALIIMTSLHSCKNAESKELEQEAVKVSFQTIAETERELKLRYSATIEADNTAQIGFAVSGIVSKIMVEEGQNISQGQLLASLDTTIYNNSYLIANSSHVQTLDLFERQYELFKKGSLPVSEFNSIKARLEQAAANKRISTKELADCKLFSPMSGIITEKKIERGSTAGPGIVSFTIIKTDQVYATVYVPEIEVGDLLQGMDVSIYIPTLSETRQGKVTIINPQADTNSKTYKVKVKLDNKDQRLLPGMLAEVKIHPKRTERAIVVPATSVVRDTDNFTYVYVVNESNKAIRKRIVVGEITGMQELIIDEGLHNGDKVITSGLSRLKDGTTVTY